MKSIKAAAAVAVVLFLAGVIAAWSSAASAGTQGGFQSPMTVGQVSITNDQVLSTNPELVEAFIPTNSKGTKCMVTLNDTTFVTQGTQVFCANRTSPTYGPGVQVTIDYFQSIPSGYLQWVTVWQNGATSYGAPIVCTTSGTC